MVQYELDTKERIIDATIALIKENKNVNQITMRSIAEKAEVGIGLINYHFQTKDNLIKQCVQQVIGELFGKSDEEKLDNLQPIDKLKLIIKYVVSFIMTNPELSRISMLTDLTSAKENDNSDHTMKLYYPVFKEVFGETKNEIEIKVIIQVITATIQVTFLRGEVYKQYSGINFFDEKQRNEFIDIMINLIL
ncbi:MAG: TetR/AcrR family transcriptional regulator [Bacillota bacterium]